MGASFDDAMRAFSAKVCESSSAGSIFSASFGGGCAVEGEEEEEEASAKGFAFGWGPVEKGLLAAEPGAEKGFAFWVDADVEGLTPKRDSPMLVCLGLGSSAAGGAGFSFVEALVWVASWFWASLEMRVVLMPRTEPSFLRHAFCLQANI